MEWKMILGEKSREDDDETMTRQRWDEEAQRTKEQKSCEQQN